MLENLWVAPLTPTVMVMRGLAFHPSFLSMSLSGLYLFNFYAVTVVGNLS